MKNKDKKKRLHSRRVSTKRPQEMPIEHCSANTVCVNIVTSSHLTRKVLQSVGFPPLSRAALDSVSLSKEPFELGSNRSLSSFPSFSSFFHPFIVLFDHVLLIFLLLVGRVCGAIWFRVTSTQITQFLPLSPPPLPLLLSLIHSRRSLTVFLYFG